MLQTSIEAMYHIYLYCCCLDNMHCLSMVAPVLIVDPDWLLWISQVSSVLGCTLANPIQSPTFDIPVRNQL